MNKTRSMFDPLEPLVFRPTTTPKHFISNQSNLQTVAVYNYKTATDQESVGYANYLLKGLNTPSYNGKMKLYNFTRGEDNQLLLKQHFNTGVYGHYHFEFCNQRTGLIAMSLLCFPNKDGTYTNKLTIHNQDAHKLSLLLDAISELFYATNEDVLVTRYVDV